MARAHLRRTLWRSVAVDVLVEAARPRARVTAHPARGRGATALQDIGGGGILVFGDLSLIHAPGRVAPIRPDREGEVTERRYPEVIASERHRPAGKLLVVGIAAHLCDPGRRRPAGAPIAGPGGEDVEGRRGQTAGTVANRPLGRVVGIQAAIPPRSEEHTSELQSRGQLVCRLLLEKKKRKKLESV